MELKDVSGSVQEAVSSAVDAGIGAAVGAAETAGAPGRTIERGLGRLERKGQPVRRALHSELKATATEVGDAAGEIAGALLPERIVLGGLRLVKARARRVDLIGEFAYRGLDLVHGSLKDLAGALNRLERASEPPARPSRSVSRAAKTSAAQGRSTARRTTRRAAGTAKRATGGSTRTRSRRTTRRSRAA